MQWDAKMSTRLRYHALICHCGWPRLAACCLLAFASTLAFSQQRISQDGRLFDANPQLGGSRYNYGMSGVNRPLSPLSGNLMATGNVGRGFSLRTLSPISSTTAFRGTLGSSSLSNFMRDSVSVADAGRPLGGLTPGLFYDPARTAPTSGFLQGYLGTPAAFSTQAPGFGRSTGGSAPYGTPPAFRPAWGDPTQLANDPTRNAFNRQFASSIFGPPRLPGPLTQAELQPQATYVPELISEDPEAALQAIADGRQTQEPMDMRIWTEPTVPGALDIMSQQDASELLTGHMAPRFLQPTEAPTATGQPGEADLTAAGAVPAPSIAGTLAGSDVFTDMRLALELSRDPTAEWFTDMLGAAGALGSSGQTESIETQDRAALAADAFLERVMRAPMKTFASDTASALNAEMRDAEAALQLGRYYDAVRHFERAAQIDPVNPLPLVGKGQALLAAGEYVSAANSLIRGLERFPELSRFRLDLSALLGGGEIVDIRRADIMNQLARNEDAQLRFLLGYLEIHSNNTELGIRNLDKAAAQVAPGSLIRRYPDMLRRQGLLPAVPVLPDEVQPPAPTDTQPPADDSAASGKETE